MFINRFEFGGLKEVLLESVSNYVMHHAPCSVIVVQEGEEAISESIKHDQLERTFVE
jgi:hypothetical protein